MEGLSRLVGRESYQILCGMPGRINASRYDSAVFHLYLMSLAVLHNDSTAMVGSDMEHHIRRAVAAIVMAIDAVIDGVLELTVILVNGMNIPIGKITLVYSQLAVQLVAGLDKAIAQEGINGFLCHTDCIGLIAEPLLPSLGIYRYTDISTFAVGQ